MISADDLDSSQRSLTANCISMEGWLIGTQYHKTLRITPVSFHPGIFFPSEVSQPYLRRLACHRVVGRNRQSLALSDDPSPSGVRLYLIFH